MNLAEILRITGTISNGQVRDGRAKEGASGILQAHLRKGS